ncbi:hypothetical protein ACWGI8_43705, partial [Streptomyces sp. NPDC054841]
PIGYPPFGYRWVLPHGRGPVQLRDGDKRLGAWLWAKPGDVGEAWVPKVQPGEPAHQGTEQLPVPSLADDLPSGVDTQRVEGGAASLRAWQHSALDALLQRAKTELATPGGFWALAAIDTAGGIVLHGSAKTVVDGKTVPGRVDAFIPVAVTVAGFADWLEAAGFTGEGELTVALIGVSTRNRAVALRFTRALNALMEDRAQQARAALTAAARERGEVLPEQPAGPLVTVRLAEFDHTDYDQVADRVSIGWIPKADVVEDEPVVPNEPLLTFNGFLDLQLPVEWQLTELSSRPDVQQLVIDWHWSDPRHVPPLAEPPSYETLAAVQEQTSGEGQVVEYPDVDMADAEPEPEPEEGTTGLPSGEHEVGGVEPSIHRLGKQAVRGIPNGILDESGTGGPVVRHGSHIPLAQYLRLADHATDPSPYHGANVLTGEQTLRYEVAGILDPRLWVVPDGPLTPLPSQDGLSPQRRWLIRDFPNHYAEIVPSGIRILRLGDSRWEADHLVLSELPIETGTTVWVGNHPWSSFIQEDADAASAALSGIRPERLRGGRLKLLAPAFDDALNKAYRVAAAYSLTMLDPRFSGPVVLQAPPSPHVDGVFGRGRDGHAEDQDTVMGESSSSSATTVAAPLDHMPMAGGFM